MWHSRGYLPHFDSPDKIQHVTVHMADSLPKSAIARIDQKLESLPEEKWEVERRRRLHEWIDAGHGSCLLSHRECAETVQNAFLHFDGQRYRLFAWVVMPNHFHVLFQPLKGWSVAKIVGSWKKFTGRRIKDWVRATREMTPLEEENRAARENCVPGNAVLPNCEEPIWHHEYWDRYIRNEKHFHDAVDYIHNNPVKAGLYREPRHFTWSSAYDR
jgi:REP element-mobilizing transposase RayT